MDNEKTPDEMLRETVLDEIHAYIQSVRDADLFITGSDLDARLQRLQLMAVECLITPSTPDIFAEQGE